MKVKSESEVAQSYLTHSDPMDCSLPGSSVHGIFQVGVLEWGAIAFSIQPQKKGNSAMCYNMDKLKDILLNDISQREKQIMYDINSMWNLKENKSQFHRNRE